MWPFNKKSDEDEVPQIDREEIEDEEEKESDRNNFCLKIFTIDNISYACECTSEEKAKEQCLDFRHSIDSGDKTFEIDDHCFVLRNVCDFKIEEDD